MFKVPSPEETSRVLAELEDCRQRLSRDQVTRFLNQTGFLERFGELDLTGGTAVLGIHVTNIQEVQNTYGHEVSDHYLRCLARKVRIVLRRALLHACVSRDLLLSVVPCESREEAEELVEKVESYLRGPFTYRGGIFFMRTRVCCCLLDQDEVDLSDLLVIIRRVLKTHRVKKSVVPYTVALKELQDNLPLFLHLSQKITMGEIGFALQPVVDVSSRQPEFYEVLARIPAEEQEVISAGNFVDKVEELSLMRELERAILYKTLSFLREREDVARVSINLSLDYLAESFLRDLEMFQEELRIEPERVLIEITEKSVLSLKREPTLRQRLLALKERGFPIVLDDFGQDHSNINLLKGFPWDIVKIDGEFVVELLRDDFDQELLRFLVRLSELRGFRLVAEFVETEEVARLLEEAGVHLLQGFLVGRPEFVPESLKIVPPLLYGPPL